MHSYIAKSAHRRDYRILSRPIEDRIFFAGEATHPMRNSTVHAAYEPGQRAADLVFAGLSDEVIVERALQTLGLAYP